MIYKTKYTKKRIKLSNCCNNKVRNNYCQNCHKYVGFGGWHYAKIKEESK